MGPRIATHGSRGALDKAVGVVATYPAIWTGRVIDIGCRTREMERALVDAGHRVDYVGIDIAESGDLVADISKGVPLADAHADVVVALDVLEHTDAFHDAFAEMCRLARSYAVVSLPNCYDVSLRWRMARGQAICGKYGLPVEPPEDRHRWMFSFADAQGFCKEHSARNGFTVADERAFVGPRRARVGGVVARFPNALAPTYLALLHRTNVG